MATLHMQLDFPMLKGPLTPQYVRKPPPEGPPKAPEFVHIGRQQPQTKNRPYLGLRASKRNFERP